VVIKKPCGCVGGIRASFSQERMTYIPEESKVIYRSKDDKKDKEFQST